MPKSSATEVVKGYEYDRGQFVTFTPDELKALEPESTGTIDLSTFVPRADVDPLYFNTPYYVYPDGRIAVEAFQVLNVAMTEAGLAGIGRIKAGPGPRAARNRGRRSAPRRSAPMRRSKVSGSGDADQRQRQQFHVMGWKRPLPTASACQGDGVNGAGTTSSVPLCFEHAH